MVHFVMLQVRMGAGNPMDTRACMESLRVGVVGADEYGYTHCAATLYT
jgi:hypothetical protein